MKYLILIVLLLSGCTHYKVKTPDGVEVSAWNTKNYESYELTAEKVEDSWSVKLEETGVMLTVDELIAELPVYSTDVE